MSLVELIAKKRDGHEHTAEEVRRLISAFTAEQLTDYQLAAWLMAVFFRGMSDAETVALTEAMLHSGDVLDFSDIPGSKVDKHSTGGVGDKVSLCLAPLVAACGVKVPMVSGRGLGHTGGTLDKLEAIPGFNVTLFVNRCESREGCALLSQRWNSDGHRFACGFVEVFDRCLRGDAMHVPALASQKPCEPFGKQ